jgi:glycosyltransferase involved in cell wall biosynthesis
MLVYVILVGLVLLAGTVVSSVRSAVLRKLRRPRAAVIVFSYFQEDARPRREADALTRNGYDIDVLCLRRDLTERIHERVGGTSLYRLPLRRRRSGLLTYVFQYSVFLLGSFIFLSLRAFRGYRIVHVHNMPDVLVFSALVPRLLGAKVILDLHDPMPELFRAIYDLKGGWAVRALKLIEKWSIRFADAVLTPNIAFKELFVSRGCPKEKIGIIMNSPDETLFNARACVGQQRLPGYNVMFHGTLVERNGLGFGIEAIAQIHQRIPGLKLHIYGEPTPYSLEIMRRVEKLKISACIEYHGYRPLREMPRAIAVADLGIVPSLANPFNNINLPIRILEYLSMGKLPIAPRTKGVLDYFREDELLFFTPGDVSDLARCIEWAYSHPVQAQEIVQRGQQTYEGLRWHHEEQRFLALVRALSRPVDQEAG